MRSSYEPGRFEVPISYRHPVTGQVVDIEVLVVRRSLLPRPGVLFRVAVDPANPDVVTVPHDGDEIPGALYSLLIVNGVVIAAAAVRWHGVRATDRLVRSGRPSFAMLGSLERSSFDRRHVTLHLFALDARPGARAVCATTVLTTAQMPVGGGCFPIEVRGRPVPGGRFVARAGGGILRPLRRPIGRGSGRRPADDFDGVRPPVPVAQVPDSKVPSIWQVFGAARLVFVAGTVVALVVVTSVAVAHGRRDAGVLARGTPVIAEIMSKTDDLAQVRYGLPGERRTHKASIVTFRSVGRLYPAHVDTLGGRHIVLDADPYNALPFVVALGALLLTAVAVVAASLAWWREARRLQRDGPWFALAEVRSEAAHEVGLVLAGESAPVALLRGAAEGTADEMVVASTFDPGEPAALSGVANGLRPLRRRWRDVRRLRVRAIWRS